MEDTVSLKQLPLQISLKDDCLLETYYPGENAQAVSQIQKTAEGRGEQYLYLWGREGVGRTHLLQGACLEAHALQRASLYLSLKEHALSQTSLLQGLERLDLICLDDVDAIAGIPAWEEALFHCFNRIRASERSLIIAGNVSPKALPVQLPDLKSRLSWGVVYPLVPLNDEHLLKALQLRAHQRGLVLSNEVGLFLIRRLSRSMPALYGVLDKLDAASLAAQRNLTIPFVKSCLGL